jgi:hypothetical protein
MMYCEPFNQLEVLVTELGTLRDRMRDVLNEYEYACDHINREGITEQRLVVLQARLRDQLLEGWAFAARCRILRDKLEHKRERG